MTTHIYEPMGIKAYVITNPTLTFTRIVDNVTTQIGSHELSKALWELLKDDIPDHEPTLTGWIENCLKNHKTRTDIELTQRAILDQDITRSPEVALEFAKKLLDTKSKPYYQFHDLIPSTPFVPDLTRETFSALIKTVQRMHGATGVAFLVDDFTDITLKNHTTSLSHLSKPL